MATLQEAVRDRALREIQDGGEFVEPHEQYNRVTRRINSWSNSDLLEHISAVLPDVED